MNKIILTGRLVKEPEFKKTHSDTSSCIFTIAVERDYKNKETGEREADFLRVIIWNKFADNLYPMLSKGKKILVEGQIRTNSFENEDGTKRYTTDIYGTKIEFLEKKKLDDEDLLSDDDIDSAEAKFLAEREAGSGY